MGLADDAVVFEARSRARSLVVRRVPSLGLTLPAPRPRGATGSPGAGGRRALHSPGQPATEPTPVKRLILVLGLALVAALGAWKLSGARGWQWTGELVARVETGERVVALTFDDGPTDRYTGEVLAVLAAREVPATFFLVGQAIRRHPEATRRIVEAGHEIGNHSYSHRRMVAVTPGFVDDELSATDAAIREAGYEGPVRFRPPYGKKLVVLPWYLARNGRTTVTWDVEPETWLPVDAPPRDFVNHVLERVRPGSIVLLHVMFDARESTRQALPAIIDALRGRGYRFVTVSELLALREKEGRGA